MIKKLICIVERLSSPGSDLAQQSLKDPYLFDFLDVGNEADEREIESALVRHKSQPIDVADYKLLESLPKELQTNLAQHRAD